MTPKEILDAKLFERPIFHPKRPNTIYTLIIDTKIKINGEWVEGMVYTDGEQMYCRELDNFKKFQNLIV